MRVWLVRFPHTIGQRVDYINIYQSYCFVWGKNVITYKGNKYLQHLFIYSVHILWRKREVIDGTKI